jgi:prepilin-type processing-associated H-X9-DG protein
MYTDDNADKYPMANEWEKVLMQYIGDENTLKCPKDQHSYRYFGNGQNRAKTQDPKSTIVLICECSHQGKTNACFVDGHVEAVASEQVEKAIKTANSEEFPILQ